MISTLNVRDTFNYNGSTNVLKDNSAINQCLKVLLLTTISELFGDPKFGSQLRLLFFSNMSDVFKDILSDHIINIINRYDTRVIVNTIEISFDNISAKCYINLTYSYQDTYSTINIYLPILGD